MVGYSLERILLNLPAILLAITIHEYAHGKVAHMLGDPTPEQQGRLTLNPIPHIDPLGALLFIVAGFGWAKPVLVNPFHFRGDRNKGMMLVAFAGPASNIMLALLGTVVLALFGNNLLVAALVTPVIWFNIILAVFNLLPVPPLDGSKILAGILPMQMRGFVHQLETYGPLILILLVVTGVTGRILIPIVNGIWLFLSQLVTLII